MQDQATRETSSFQIESAGLVKQEQAGEIICNASFLGPWY